MSQGQQQAAAPHTEQQLESLLDQALARTPNKKFPLIQSALDSRVEKIREVLPANLKDEAERFVKRAMIEFDRRETLQKCTPASFIRCVIQAAELGLAVDGRLAYAVPYKGKAQLQLDYKGWIAVAKRSGQIIDIRGDVICENDHFEHGTSGTTSRCEHTYDHAKPRGEVVGACAVLYLPGGLWKYTYMQIDEINNIRNRSPAYKNNSGPWLTDTNQMRIKTVFHRALKLYCDDPSVGGVLTTTEHGYETATVPGSPRRATRSTLNDDSESQEPAATVPQDYGLGTVDSDPHADEGDAAAEKMEDQTPKPDPPPDVPDALTEYSASIHAVKSKTKVKGIYKELAAGAFGEEAAKCLDAAKALRDWKLRQLAGPTQGTLI